MAGTTLPELRVGARVEVALAGLEKVAGGFAMSVNVHGDRVRQARILRRMTGSEVAATVGWSSARQTRLERSGWGVASSAEFSALCEKLRVPVGYLARAPRPALTEEDLLFRAPKAMQKRERTYLAEFARMAEEFFWVLNEQFSLPAVRLTQVVPGRSIVEVAQEFRRVLGVSAQEPIPNLVHAMERAGVLVIARSESLAGPSPEAWSEDARREGVSAANERHLGYSTWTGEYRERPLVVMRMVDSWERTRWTLAHEAGHLVLHRGLVPKNAESEASAFASELLAPMQALEADLPPHITLAGLIDVKLRWGMSLGALLQHLRANARIDEVRYKALSTQLYTRMNPVTEQTWGKTEPGWDDRQPERPRLLSKWVESFFGTTSPDALVTLPSLREQWPADWLSQLLIGQRGAPKVIPEAAPVISMPARVRSGTSVDPLESFTVAADSAVSNVRQLRPRL